MSANNQLKVQKNQKRHSTGKKKHHTQKAQVMADRKNSQIIATSFSHGNNHEFQPLKDDAIEFPEYLCILADASYQGLMELQKTARHHQEIQVSCSGKTRKTKQSGFGTETDRE